MTRRLVPPADALPAGGGGGRAVYRCGVLLLSAGLAAPLFAHHSWSTDYKVNDPEVEIAGVITRLDWKNPHVRLEVTSDAGQPTARTWLIETTSVAQLIRMDVTPGLVKVGQSVRIAGYAGFRTNMIYMNHLLLPDNREVIFLADAAPRWSGVPIGNSRKLAGQVTEPDVNKRPATIFAVWNTVYGDPRSHGFAAQQIALKARAEEAARKGQPLPTVPLSAAPGSAEYCAPKALQAAMANPYPIQFLKRGRDIQLKLELDDQVRTIRMGRGHDDSGAAPSLMGYSSGEWQGSGEKKLIVTTTRFAGKDLGPRARLVEVFELSDDRNRLNYTATLSDPDKPGAPVTTGKYWQYQPGSTVQPYNCSL